VFECFQSARKEKEEKVKNILIAAGAATIIAAFISWGISGSHTLSGIDVRIQMKKVSPGEAPDVQKYKVVGGHERVIVETKDGETKNATPGIPMNPGEEVFLITVTYPTGEEQVMAIPTSPDWKTH
jgi:hypothetical protein